jgi:hypothetical protein
MDNDKPKLVQEVKCRFLAKDKYPELKIDKHKIDANLTLAEKHRIKFFLSVWWGAMDRGDPVSWGRVINREQAAQFKVQTWGRDDRPNQHNGDQDQSYLIPIRSFLWCAAMNRMRLKTPNTGSTLHLSDLPNRFEL